MATLTTDRRTRRLAEIEAVRKRAWNEYRDSVRDLGGREYEDAEAGSWERLQARLAGLDGERERLESG